VPALPGEDGREAGGEVSLDRSTRPRRRVGLYLVGALGDVATTVAVGLAALARGRAEPVGLVTELPELGGAEALDLARFDEIVLGGCDVRDGAPIESAHALAREARLFPSELVELARPDLEAFGAALGRGYLTAPAPSVEALSRGSPRAARLPPADAVLAFREDLRAFRAARALDALVVVHLASTEAFDPAVFSLARPDDLDALAARGPTSLLPASVCYAWGAILEGAPFVNFTPSPGSSVPALVALADARGVPHMGRDGKTGETLLKTVLGPMFRARAFRVLSWTGFNILGNRDGLVLDDPDVKRAKLETKGSVLRSILGDRLGTDLVRIEYVPSISDWKTAWDFVHFEGFLGGKMSLELTWRGSDSLLAAPLAIDLARLVERAARAGLRGLQRGLACFFKQPAGVEEHAFAAQFEMLKSYAATLRAAPRPEPART